MANDPQDNPPQSSSGSVIGKPLRVILAIIALGMIGKTTHTNELIRTRRTTAGLVAKRRYGDPLDDDSTFKGVSITSAPSDGTTDIEQKLEQYLDRLERSNEAQEKLSDIIQDILEHLTEDFELGENEIAEIKRRVEEHYRDEERKKVAKEDEADNDKPNPLINRKGGGGKVR